MKKINKRYKNSILAIKIHHSTDVKQVIMETIKQLYDWLDYHDMGVTADFIVTSFDDNKLDEMLYLDGFKDDYQEEETKE